MNMLVGVLVEVVQEVAATEKEALELNFVKAKMVEVLQNAEVDVNKDMAISKTEFRDILLNREATKALHEVGVDVVGLVDFVDFIFGSDFEDKSEGTSLSFSDFMEVVLQLRGSNKATVKDVVDLRKFVTAQFIDLKKVMHGLLLRPTADDSDAFHTAIFPCTLTPSTSSQLMQHKFRQLQSPDEQPVNGVRSTCTSCTCGRDVTELKYRMARIEDLLQRVLLRLPPELSGPRAAVVSPLKTTELTASL